MVTRNKFRVCSDVKESESCWNDPSKIKFANPLIVNAIHTKRIMTVNSSNRLFFDIKFTKVWRQYNNTKITSFSKGIWLGMLKLIEQLVVLKTYLQQAFASCNKQNFRFSKKKKCPTFIRNFSMKTSLECTLGGAYAVLVII